MIGFEKGIKRSHTGYRRLGETESSFFVFEGKKHESVYIANWNQDADSDIVWKVSPSDENYFLQGFAVAPNQARTFYIYNRGDLYQTIAFSIFEESLWQF